MSDLSRGSNMAAQQEHASHVARPVEDGSMIIILAALLLSDAVPLVHNGQPGNWFPLAEASECADLAERAPLVRERMRLLEQRDLVAGRELATVRIALDNSLEQSSILQSQLERSIERGNSVWRSPVLWFVTGVSTAVIGILIAR